jgi:hypothetical protein
MRNPAALSYAEAVTLEGIRKDPEAAVAHDLARRFTTMIQRREADSLDPWLSSCAESGSHLR